MRCLWSLDGVCLEEIAGESVHILPGRRQRERWTNTGQLFCVKHLDAFWLLQADQQYLGRRRRAA